MSLYIYKAEVLRVVDGDTVDCKVDLGFNIYTDIRFRLSNIDTPETWRPKTEAERTHGKAATEYLKNLIDNKPIIIETDKDKHGKYRWLCEIYVDDTPVSILTGIATSVNESLVDAGYEKRDNYSDV